MRLSDSEITQKVFTIALVVAAMGYNIDKSKLGRYFIEWLIAV